MDPIITDPTHHTERSESLSDCPNDLFIREHQFNLESPVLSTEFLLGDHLICLGCEDGVTRVLSTTSKKIQYQLVKNDKSPVVGLASSPQNSSIKNSVMAVHSSGCLEYWHTTSQQLLFSKQYESALQSCEISNNGEWYVISQQNGDMLLGHLNKGNPQNLETGHLGSHANRVFCIKWHPTDPNLFYSGGWDRAVFFWDVRTKTAINKRFGYFIGGQAIDVKDHEILLGNNENEYPLRIYDQKADQVREVLWSHYSHESRISPTGVNSCCFGKEQGEILALTSRNEVRMLQGNKCLSLLQHEDPKAKGYSMTSAFGERQIVTAWSNSSVKILTF